MKGKAGRVYSLTPKGEKALEVMGKALQELEKELASLSQDQSDSDGRGRNLGRVTRTNADNHFGKENP
jgi:DNA-binding PadR family transcriptional regulator